MSIIFNVFSNHDLTIGDNYREVITLVEEKLDSTIWKSRDARELRSTNDEPSNSLLFHTVHKFYEMKFGEWPICIETNSPLCDWFRIYKHFIEFNMYSVINPKTHIWRNIIARNSAYWALELWTEQGFDEVLGRWAEAKAFISMITKRFGGDTLLYFNDGDMSIGCDLISDGITLANLLEVLPKEKKMYSYKDLEENKFEFTDSDWFYEKI